MEVQRLGHFPTCRNRLSLFTRGGPGDSSKKLQSEGPVISWALLGGVRGVVD